MKLFFTSIIFLLLLAGCGSQNVIEPYLAEEGEELTREHFLYDLNHFEYILKNNLGLLDVAYWHNQIDVLGMIDHMRNEVLLAPEDFGIYDFRHKFSEEFVNTLFPFAHFDVLFPDVETIQVPQGSLSVRPFPHDLIPLFDGKEELLDEFLHYYFDTRCTTSFVARFFAENFDDIPPLVESFIIEEGRIALLSIRQFVNHDMALGVFDDDMRQITTFIQQAQDFDHLIIDLRGNPSGDQRYFLNHIVSPLINSPKTADIFYFTPHGEYARRFTGEPEGFITGDNGGRRSLSADFLVDSSIRPTIDILNENYMPEIKIEDFERLPYGFRGRMQALPQSNSNFNGNILLLTDEHMYSGAQLAAWFAKESGFATLVGDITGGHYGGALIEGYLPNTGISFIFDMFYATDSHGRPLEAGTIPHYFNLPGLDALETVLHLISKLE
ncbi:MAG: S41 family peptidase [Defluviitaleaceae bacterium]|nr:S41 family peptidase [Defluviitaleaceae bacterium]